MQTELLAGIFDVLQWANRQRAGKGPKPKPIKRPSDPTAIKFGGTPMQLDDLDALLGWESPRPRQ